MLGRATGVCLLLAWGLSRPAQADHGARSELEEASRLAEIGALDEALKSIEIVLANDPGYLPAYKVAVPIWFRAGRLERARKALEALSVRCHSCSFAWYGLGATYRKQGRFDLAALAYEEFLKLRPKDPDGLFGYAMALVASEDMRSIEVLETYLELEQRPERQAFVQQARRELKALGKEPRGKRAPALSSGDSPAWQAEFEALLQEQRFLSAEALLESRVPGAEGRAARRHLAMLRGRWPAVLGYDALSMAEKPFSWARASLLLGDLQRWWSSVRGQRL
jgi:tetratricopeptide (TPR) repeat protein